MYAVDILCKTRLQTRLQYPDRRLTRTLQIEHRKGGFEPAPQGPYKRDTAPRPLEASLNEPESS